MQIKPVSQVQRREIDWLWTGRLALGKLASLSGDTDLGKSFIALDLCTRLSRNWPMPDGSAAPGPANSMYLYVEDGQEDTVRPRLDSLGADIDRVFVPDLNDADELMLLPRDLDQLDAMLVEHEAKLVVLDPMMAFLDHTMQSFNEQSVRRLLTPLKMLAEKRHCTILLVRHLNKAVTLPALYRGAASMALSSGCRSAWLVAHMPDGDGRCVMAQQKNNNAPTQPSLVYEVCAAGDGQGKVVWHGATHWTDEDLLSRRRQRPTPERDEAMAFLREFLADGPKTSRQIWAAAAKHGHTKITLRRAARKLKLEFKSIWQKDDRLSYWLLPGQKPPPVDPSTDIEPWLGPMREQFPSASPLDDISGH